MTDPTGTATGAMTGDAAPGARPRGPGRGAWVRFAVVASAIVVVDQATKAAVVGALAPGERVELLGEWLRVVHGRNSGILFGLLPESAPLFAVVSLLVVAGLVGYHARAGRPPLVGLGLALLLGGAVGNLVDRIRLGAVVDFVDMGIGAWRFYTYNVADAAITASLVLLGACALIPRLATWRAA